MSYTPNAPAIFIAAYASAMAGMGISAPTSINVLSIAKTPIIPGTPDYTTIAAAAGAWAQQFDTAWGGVRPVSDLDITMTEEACEAVWYNRNTPPPKNVQPSAFTVEVNAIIAAITSAETYFTANGIPQDGTSGVVTLAGDVVGPSNANTVEALQGVALPVPPGSGTTVLTDISGVLSWLVITPSGVPAVTFTDGSTQNTGIASNRIANQSASDSTSAALGLTNFTSDTTNAQPANTGLYATISGGDQNTTTPGTSNPDYASIGGGLLNQVSAIYGTVSGGHGNIASGSGATIPGGIGNTASGQNSHAVGNGNLASGNNSTVSGFNNSATAGGATVSGGGGNQATNVNAYAEGELTTSSGTASHSEGISTTASGNGSHSEGNGGTSAGTNSHVEGQNCSVITGAIAAHAEGFGCQANDLACHAEGNGCIAGSGITSSPAHAEGQNTLAIGIGAHAQGWLCNAQSIAGDAVGEGSFTSYEAQSSIASGPAVVAPTAAGCIQTSTIVMRGTTPGSVPGETATLGYGNTSPPTQNGFALQDGKVYNIIAECAVQIPATPLAAGHTISACVRVTGGVSTIAGTGTADVYGDPSYIASGSALAFSIAGGNVLQLKWTSGFGGDVVAWIAATVRITEIGQAI